MQDRGELRGLNGEQSSIEENVKVCTKEKAVLRVVRILTAVGQNVRRFKGLDRIAAGNGTPATVRCEQRIPEGSLATPQRNCAGNTLSSVSHIGGIEIPARRTISSP